MSLLQVTSIESAFVGHACETASYPHKMLALSWSTWPARECLRWRETRSNCNIEHTMGSSTVPGCMPSSRIEVADCSAEYLKLCGGLERCYFQVSVAHQSKSHASIPERFLRWRLHSPVAPSCSQHRAGSLSVSPFTDDDGTYLRLGSISYMKEGR
jgi:hypothetical protein